MKKQASNKKEEKFIWHFVYKGTNITQKEIYHGVSKELEARKNGSHCNGGTVALRHWNCDKDNIEWITISKHKTQTRASAVSHNLERTHVRKGYIMIKTAGK